MTLLRPTINAAITTALLLAWSLAAARQPLPAPDAGAAARPTAISSKLSRQQLNGLLTYPDQVLIVDVRRPEEIARIGGFGAYLNIQASELDANASFIPRDRSVITVSNHAGRALKAADALLAKGFKVAGAVGAQDYEAEGGKLARYPFPVPAPVPNGPADAGQKRAAP